MNSCLFCALTMTLAFVLFAPFMLQQKCHVEAWAEHPLYVANASAWGYFAGTYRDPPWAIRWGSHCTAVISAQSLAVLLWWRSDRFRDGNLGLIAKVYSWVFILWGIVSTMVGLTYAICVAVPVTFVLMQMMQYALYTAAQLILCHMTILRLRMTSSEREVRISQRLFCVAVAGITIAILGLLIGRAGWKFRAPLVMVVTLVTNFSFLVFVVFYFLFQVFTIWKLIEAAFGARMESQVSQGKGSTAAQTALFTALAVAASSSTTMLMLAMVAWSSFTGPPLWCELSIVLDVTSDVALATISAGIVGTRGRREADLSAVGALVQQRRMRQIRERLQASASASAGPAAALAALFDGTDPEELFQCASGRFRAISWDVLRRHEGLLTDGGSLDGGRHSRLEYLLSAPCGLGCCDAFFSHCWRDSGCLKWLALERWCLDFVRRHRRVPRLWLDKVCVDQQNVGLDLPCLPIFLAGCNTLLVTSGPEYTRRLWCCMELFVYVAMMQDDGSRLAPTVLTLSDRPEELRRVVGSWLRFEVRACECLRSEDKRRILAVIQRHPGGAQGFNERIRELGRELFQDPAREAMLDAQTEPPEAILVEV